MLEISDMTFTYDQSDLPTLRNINLNIQKGECVLLTGVSGSGKSTLLHCINGLNPAYYGGCRTGAVKIEGKETGNMELREISGFVGTVFQNPSTQFFQTEVEDELAFGLEYRSFENSEIKRKIEQVSRDLRIENLVGRSLFSLSSGEKQKCAIASVSILEQPLILFDEPTANLDPDSIRDVVEMLKKLKSSGRTIIIAEHRLHFLKNLIDRVILMKNGEIIHDGKPEILNDDSYREKENLRAWDLETVRPVNTNQPTEIIEDIKLSDIKWKKNGKNILNGISLSLSKGSVTAVVGPNGAGKTSMARVVSGLERKAEGFVIKDNERIKVKKTIGETGFVMQQPDQQLFTDSVEKELFLGKKDGKNHIEYTETLLKEFDLLPLADRHPHSLSGGEKQRVAIAAGISLNPDILILDEPTSGMDGFRLKKLASEIRRLADSGKTILIITHDYELIQLSCDMAVTIKKGTVEKFIHRDNFNELLTWFKIN